VELFNLQEQTKLRVFAFIVKRFRVFRAPLQDLIVKGIGTTDIEKRKAIYKELYKELSDDPPVILLNYRKLLYAHNARIKGIDPEKYDSISSNLPVLSIEQ
ncbi:hypothetical protein AAHB56_31770, partial [Bacillus thuringiensis]